MKKIFTLIAAALMSVSLFATPAAVPTVQDVATAGFDVTNARVVVLYFDEQVCNDIVWAGSYNSWNTDPANMLTLESLENYPGWYVTEFYDDSDELKGKPVQLTSDGSFSWNFQSGDVEAWINMGQPGSKTANIIEGIATGEAECIWTDKGVYIYEVAYFKNHNSPCIPYKYTTYANWQIKYGNEWVWTENMTKVEEGLFKLEILWEGSGFNVKSDDNPIKKDWYDVNDPDVHIAEDVIAPITVDVYLKVIDDETLKIDICKKPSASGPTVDKTGITINGRKYGFPVRMATESPAAK